MNLIDVKNIWKIYGEGKESETIALNDISFSVKEGEFVAIMGPSGCGKSTLLHILGLLDHPTRGALLMDGGDVSDCSDEELALQRNRKIGFVFQSFHLLPRVSVIENVRAPLIYSSIKEAEWNEMTINAIESVGMQHRLQHEPSQLSGGEKQRVAIARALVNHPKIIFADEPTGNLDSKSGRTVMEILQSLNEKEGKTIVLVTHETYTAEHSERIIKMMDGRIESDEKVLKRRKASVEFLK
jgi:putative ABC transport system ATP-binding protein